jgi:Ni/Co efflux regulator RcnB
MKKLVLFVVALFVASGASAYAQSKDSSNEHATTRHHRAMAAHAHWQDREGAVNYQPREREFIAPMVGPYDDPEAEGRTSGG